jgi:hypothetical protein
MDTQNTPTRQDLRKRILNSLSAKDHQPPRQSSTRFSRRNPSISNKNPRTEDVMTFESPEDPSAFSPRLLAADPSMSISLAVSGETGPHEASQADTTFQTSGESRHYLKATSSAQAIVAPRKPANANRKASKRKPRYSTFKDTKVQIEEAEEELLETLQQKKVEKEIMDQTVGEKVIQNEAQLEEAEREHLRASTQEIARKEANGDTGLSWETYLPRMLTKW